MDKVSKYCRELEKVYNREDINSSKAAIYRKKILQLLLSLDDGSEGEKSVDLFWRSAYYNPMASLRKCKDIDQRWLCLMVSIFCGELHAQLLSSPSHAALYNLYLGDLHRYLPDSSQSSLCLLYYQRSVEVDPFRGRSFNQLALIGDDIDSVRFYLQSIISPVPFRASLDNLKRKLKESCEDSLLTSSFELLLVSIMSSGKGEVTLHGDQFLSRARDLDDPLRDERMPKIVQSLSLGNHPAIARSDDTFLSFATCLVDIFMFLLDKVSYVRDTDEEENVAISRIRRRGSSSCSENTDSEGDEEHSLTSMESVEKGQLYPEESVIWPLSVCCEWFTFISDKISDFRAKKIPIPAVFTDQFTSLMDKLIGKLNELVTLLNLVIDESEAEQTNWLLYGPDVGLDENGRARSLRQVSYHAAQLCNTETAAVEFVDYFRRKKGVRDNQSDLLRKMGELRSEDARKKVSQEDWIPVYIVIDKSVFENHIGILRTLVVSQVLISVIPSFVLAQLDKRKDASPDVRTALRFIQQRQACGRLRVVESSCYEECCEKLANSVSEGGASVTTAVALLVTEIEDYYDLTIPAVAIYHVESFHERWCKKSSGS